MTNEQLKNSIRTSIMKKNIIRVYCEEFNYCLISVIF